MGSGRGSSKGAAPMVSRPSGYCASTRAGSRASTSRGIGRRKNRTCSPRRRMARGDRRRMWITSVSAVAQRLWRGCARTTLSRRWWYADLCTRWDIATDCTTLRYQALRTSSCDARATSSSCMGVSGTGMRGASSRGCQNRAWNSGVQSWMRTVYATGEMRRGSVEPDGGS